MTALLSEKPNLKQTAIRVAADSLSDQTFDDLSLSRQSIQNSTEQATTKDSQSNANRGVLRVTNSIAQYDVSNSNPKALANLGKALAGSLDRDDFTYFDPEIKNERRLGDVLVSVDLSNPEEVILLHRETAGKGNLGRLMQSLGYIVRNPLHCTAMKGFGIVADPEVIYKQKVTQILAQLDREGLFGPPGASTFNLDDWQINTRNSWRDVVISRKTIDKESIPLSTTSFSESLRNSFRLSGV